MRHTQKDKTMHPTGEEFSELVCYISELKHQLAGKVDEQTVKINDHSEIVEELLWQIRELSDKLPKMSTIVDDLERKVSEAQKAAKESSCICHYQNHLIPARYRPNRSIFSRQTSMISRKSSTRQQIATTGGFFWRTTEYVLHEFLFFFLIGISTNIPHVVEV